MITKRCPLILVRKSTKLWTKRWIRRWRWLCKWWWKKLSLCYLPLSSKRCKLSKLKNSQHLPPIETREFTMMKWEMNHLWGENLPQLRKRANTLLFQSCTIMFNQFKRKRKLWSQRKHPWSIPTKRAQLQRKLFFLLSKTFFKELLRLKSYRIVHSKKLGSCQNWSLNLLNQKDQLLQIQPGQNLLSNQSEHIKVCHHKKSKEIRIHTWTSITLMIRILFNSQKHKGMKRVVIPSIKWEQRLPRKKIWIWMVTESNLQRPTLKGRHKGHHLAHPKKRKIRIHTGSKLFSTQCSEEWANQTRSTKPAKKGWPRETFYKCLITRIRTNRTLGLSLWSWWLTTSFGKTNRTPTW